MRNLNPLLQKSHLPHGVTFLVEGSHNVNWPIIYHNYSLVQLLRRARILVQVTINRRLLIGWDGHLDQSEAYDLS